MRLARNLDIDKLKLLNYLGKAGVSRRPRITRNGAGSAPTHANEGLATEGSACG